LLAEITKSTPKDKSRAIEIQSWEKLWDEYLLENESESLEWRIFYKLIGYAIKFEKLLKYDLAYVDDEAGSQRAITKYVRNFMAFSIVKLNVD